MSDYIVRVADKDHQVRLYVAITKELVEKARSLHNTSPVATAALGRTLTAGAIMGSMMKGNKDLLTLQFKGDGPLGGILVTANSDAIVKGYVNRPDVDLPLKSNGKLDVSGAIGNGFLNVIKDIGMKEPYNGQIDLISGEIAEDLTYYFASSEQTPSVVALGVLVDQDYTVRQSGGFILQLMPGAKDEVIDRIEANIKNLPSVTAMLDAGTDGEGIAKRVLEGLPLTFHEKIHPRFECDCSKERVEKALITVGSDEIEDMIQEGEPIAMSCQFCNTEYIFDLSDLRDILDGMNIV
jgi:molecular chaperone Hsp33